MTENEFLNVKETAEMLKIQDSTLYSYLHYKQLPENLYRKIGRKVIFIKQAVLDWFYSGAELKKRG